ncbi:LysR family transcriptional regulator [Streptomyces sp. Ru73]|uniref:LysR family transcriptional regulator n=1 Tax=Streptomyces sp. Ru73 TaxID=2080748 RepID=UPI001C67F096|nr:LysR family transcriptional regulator [Streptomyces sp. Ru73]
MLERLEIESFVILAEELHFGRTAERLRVTRARVSQTIQSLERRVGAPLFERTSRRVRLTPLGQQFLDEVEPGYRRILRGLATVQAAAKGIEGSLTVGYLGPAAGEFVLEVIDDFTRRYAGVAVRIHETQIKSMFDPLRQDEADLLVTQFPVDEPDLVRGPVVLRVPRMLAVPANHVLAKQETVSVEDMARDRVFACTGHVPDYWQEHLAPSRTPEGRPVLRGRSAATLQETLAMVGAGQGISPVGADVAAYVMPRNVAYVPFRDAGPLEYGMVWRAAGETARLRAFAAVAAERAREWAG